MKWRARSISPYRPGKTCLREMEWVWRGEHYAATSSDYSAIKAQLEAERFPAAWEGGPTRFWADLAGGSLITSISMTWE